MTLWAHAESGGEVGARFLRVKNQGSGTKWCCSDMKKRTVSDRAFFVFLFPLDCGWGFGGDVVDYAVDAADFVDYLVADFCEEFVGEVYPVGGHAIG